ncbi:hypothetical protein [Terriglobus tenax]|uniref:hypothetical protein n=1 Tax=Terriglobus tenax TaxID=1111115 RepID=UPI0021DFCE40|nr:hypothetical protein [Terriglobus tenax]
MATAAVSVKRPVNPDRVFFPVLLGLMLLTVWLGFSKTYYAVGMMTTHLPSPIVHVHAVVFTLWLMTLAVQIGLVSARKVKLHMSVGLWGFGLAALVVVLGALASRDSLRRGFSPPGSGLSPLTFFVVPMSDLVVFSVLAGWSYAARRKPQIHKRLIMLASITLLDAAIGRFPYTIAPHITPMGQLGVLFSFMVLMMIYDLVTLKKIHRATWIPAVATLALFLVRIPLAMTPVWMRFAELVRG